MYVCMYVCMYVYMYVRTYVCMYVCMYVRTYVCMYASGTQHPFNSENMYKVKHAVHEGVMHEGVAHAVCRWKKTHSCSHTHAHTSRHAHTFMLTHTYSSKQTCSHTHAHTCTSCHVSCRWHGEPNDGEGWFYVWEEYPVISVSSVLVYRLPNPQLPALRTLGSVVAGSDSQTQVS